MANRFSNITRVRCTFYLSCLLVSQCMTREELSSSYLSSHCRRPSRHLVARRPLRGKAVPGLAWPIPNSSPQFGSTGHRDTGLLDGPTSRVGRMATPARPSSLRTIADRRCCFRPRLACSFRPLLAHARLIANDISCSFVKLPFQRLLVGNSGHHNPDSMFRR